MKALKLKLDLDSAQEEKVLRMFEYYFKKEIENEMFPYINDNKMIAYHSKKETIHWYELLINILSRKVFENNFYWMNVFINRCVQFYTSVSTHPIDFLYEKFEIVKNNESLFKKTENDFVLEKEEKENKKNQRKLEKQLKMKEGKKDLSEKKKILIEEKKTLKEEKKQIKEEVKQVKGELKRKDIEDNFFV